jgi:hypothetical protein
MTEASSDRRLSVREEIKIPIRVRIWKSTILEELGESENRSEKGISLPQIQLCQLAQRWKSFLKCRMNGSTQAT